MTSAHNILFLCSGGGGNLRFIHRLVQSGSLPGFTSCSVIGDRECPAIDWSVANGLQTDVVSISRENQADLMNACRLHPASVIVTNVHKIIGSELVEAYKNRILNLHYSLLPSFGGTIGMQSLSNALAYGSKIVGATAHHVTEDLDSGPPIAQVALGSVDGQINENLSDLMFRAGCIALYTALITLNDALLAQASAKAIQVKDATFLVSPACELPSALASEAFWEALKS
jgi:phosphoribosylglycinamide formyltransferase-1